jgi:lipoate---protein ligase
MKYIDLTLPTPAENLACDEALLDLSESGAEGELLRFWQPAEPFVVLGYANHAAVEADLPACDARQISVLRRCTGGGTVLQGPGCLNYTLVLRLADSSPLQTITGANRFILQRHQTALQPLLHVPVEIHGHTDLALAIPNSSPSSSDLLKFSGNAQRRKRNFLIFHGTFLLTFDLSLVEQLLPMPSNQPGYRQDRPHTRFLTNLNLAPDQIKHAVRAAWSATDPLSSLPTDRIRHLALTKYSTRDWNYRL